MSDRNLDDLFDRIDRLERMLAYWFWRVYIAQPTQGYPDASDLAWHPDDTIPVRPVSDDDVA